MRLIIGDKNWSTWSMRPWLVLARVGATFEEVPIRLRRDDTPDQIRAAGSPSGKAPALIDGEVVVWDSLAICEYLAERFPGLWPEDPRARALARSAAAEMHSGFPALRKECPMDLKLRTMIELSEEGEKDVRRIVELWKDLRTRFIADGPFLVGRWSIADAFFTPVATRFLSYGVKPAAFGDDGSAAAYQETLLAAPEFQRWEREAIAS